MAVKRGDVIVYEKGKGLEISENYDKYKVIRETDVLYVKLAD